MPTLSLWLNAFIPQTVTGYTQVLTAGPHRGKTAVPLPTAARCWPGNTLKAWNAGYLTDQRGFDPSPTASARMKSWAEVDTSTFVLMRQAHTSSGTTEVDLGTGAQLGYAVANMSRCRFTAPSPVLSSPGGFGAHLGVARGSTLPRMAPAASSLTLQLSAAAGDPLVGMAADIDYVGAFSITSGPTPGSIIVAFNGKIDAFPAYDCYATLNGVTKALFTSSPPPGNTVVNLLGPANRPVTGSVSFP